MRARALSDSFTPQGMTALHQAAKHGRAEAVRALIQAGALLESKDVSPRTRARTRTRARRPRPRTRTTSTHDHGDTRAQA